MEITEHRKLIYQLSKVIGGPAEYLKNPYLECHKVHNIWMKRAYKKGYVSLITENERCWIYDLTPKGENLLKNIPEFHLQQTKLKYNEIIDDVKERRKERRRLRKLKREGKL